MLTVIFLGNTRVNFQPIPKGFWNKVVESSFRVGLLAQAANRPGVDRSGNHWLGSRHPKRYIQSPTFIEEMKGGIHGWDGIQLMLITFLPCSMLTSSSSDVPGSSGRRRTLVARRRVQPDSVSK